MRYQYLSLAYWLEHGKWVDSSLFDELGFRGAVNRSLPRAMRNLCRESDWHDWDQYMVDSTAQLHGNERCDCSRYAESDQHIENRLYYSRRLDVQVAYFNKIGDWKIKGRSTSPAQLSSFAEYMKLKEQAPDWELTPEDLVAGLANGSVDIGTHIRRNFTVFYNQVSE